MSETCVVKAMTIDGRKIHGWHRTKGDTLTSYCGYTYWDGVLFVVDQAIDCARCLWAIDQATAPEAE